MRVSAWMVSSRGTSAILALALVFVCGRQTVAATGDQAAPPSQEKVTSQQEPAAPAAAAQAEATSAPNPFKWSWGNQITYGIGFRMKDPDQRLIGRAAGGSAFSVNGDDGNQNYDTGVFTNAVKISSEFQFSYKNFGGFVRGFAFYDIENENGDRARTPLSEDAKNRVGSRAEIRDAFAYLRFSLGPQPGEIRAGWQVINWGESTFIQGGINAINPFDVSVLRVPGSELRDALLPVGAVKFSIKPSSSTSIEGFYQYTWEELKVDPVGSYFSTTDLAGAGATKVMLGFGAAPDTIAIGQPIPGNPVGVAVPAAPRRPPDACKTQLAKPTSRDSMAPPFACSRTASGAPSSGRTS